uniref:Uncharacterized protein n=1 Tax=Rhizophagus irregularis (strain DAOM 181602 / DAOM 197198 / MUCL 43194) TaxID=747089 RepID=U9TFC8_RHIID
MSNITAYVLEHYYLPTNINSNQPTQPIFVSILLPPRCVGTVEDEVQSFYRELFKEKPNLVSSTISLSSESFVVICR